MLSGGHGWYDVRLMELAAAQGTHDVRGSMLCVLNGVYCEAASALGTLGRPLFTWVVHGCGNCDSCNCLWLQLLGIAAALLLMGAAAVLVVFCDGCPPPGSTPGARR